VEARGSQGKVNLLTSQGPRRRRRKKGQPKESYPEFRCAEGHRNASQLAKLGYVEASVKRKNPASSFQERRDSNMTRTNPRGKRRDRSVEPGDHSVMKKRVQKSQEGVMNGKQRLHSTVVKKRKP